MQARRAGADANGSVCGVVAACHAASALRCVAGQDAPRLQCTCSPLPAQAALRAALRHKGEKVLRFPAGRFLLSKPVYANVSGLVIKGAGVDRTTLVFTRSLSYGTCCVLPFPRRHLLRLRLCTESPENSRQHMEAGECRHFSAAASPAAGSGSGPAAPAAGGDADSVQHGIGHHQQPGVIAQHHMKKV